MAGVGRLTDEEVLKLLHLIERGLRGEVERLVIDFRDRQFYVETWRKEGRPVRIGKAA